MVTLRAVESTTMRCEAIVCLKLEAEEHEENGHAAVGYENDKSVKILYVYLSRNLRSC